MAITESILTEELTLVLVLGILAPVYLMYLTLVLSPKETPIRLLSESQFYRQLKKTVKCIFTEK
jgi:hypothetical protein